MSNDLLPVHEMIDATFPADPGFPATPHRAR